MLPTDEIGSPNFANGFKKKKALACEHLNFDNHA
jgi:hypothetical protein